MIFLVCALFPWQEFCVSKIHIRYVAETRNSFVSKKAKASLLAFSREYFLKQISFCSLDGFNT